MQRFLIFVDGSNLNGILRRLTLKVDDYESLFRHIFEAAAKTWRSTLDGGGVVPAHMLRVQWYEVGSTDEWDLTDPKAQGTLRDVFEKDKDTKRNYLALAGPKNPGKSQDDLMLEAWSLCFQDLKQWYEERHSLVDGFRRFHHSIRSTTDFIDVIECGHWKLDLMRRTVLEKGLDTRLAVDMVTMADCYDVAVLISGDADNIPCLDYLKAKGKHVAVVEFLAGYPPEKKGGNFSSRLKLAADFVVQTYEMDLVTKGIGKKAPELAPGAKNAAAAAGPAA